MKFRTFLTTFLIGLLITSCCDILCEREKYAKKLIEKTNEFHIQQGRLPIGVSEIDEVELEDSPAFYKKTSDTTFNVWYGTDLGSSKVYYSETNTWKIE